VTTFLDNFEASVASPVDDRPISDRDKDKDRDKSKDQAALVVEGEICRP